MNGFHRVSEALDQRLVRHLDRQFARREDVVLELPTRVWVGLSVQGAKRGKAVLLWRSWTGWPLSLDVPLPPLTNPMERAV